MIVLFIIHYKSVYHWFEAFLKENGDFEQKKVNFGGGGQLSPNKVGCDVDQGYTRGRKLWESVNLERA